MRLGRNLLIALFLGTAWNTGNAAIVQVPATTPWTDTGIDVLAGQTLQMMTDPSERVRFGFGGLFGVRTINADGIGDEGVGGGIDGTTICGAGVAMPGAVCISLVGKIGGTTAVGTGTPVPEGVFGKGLGFVGSVYSQIVPATGRLFLGFNDNVTEFFDNSGAFHVDVEVVPEPTGAAAIVITVSAMMGFFWRRRGWEVA